MRFRLGNPKQKMAITISDLIGGGEIAKIDR